MNTGKRSNRTLWYILALCAAPVIASYFAYFIIHPQTRTNYGELLAPRPVPEVAGNALDGTTFALSALKGKWVLLHLDPGACPASCEQKLYASRQARTLQNAEADRVLRVWVVTDGVFPAPSLLARHPGLLTARVIPDALKWLPSTQGGSDAIWLIDPLGNLMMRFPADPDIKAMNKDLARLLKASRIG
jgi:hypothetical protein